MRSLITVAGLLLAVSVCAYAAKPCEELKDEITKKMDAKGVKGYLLEIVSRDQVKDGEGKVVGSCDGGTKKIVYTRAAAAAASASAEPKNSK
ncbi:MAG TPA: DUF1161 domain-containing protein [Terriglobales bacterium]|nr:DUF1161 domain-containing protein [Terriglobales bacterium]